LNVERIDETTIYGKDVNGKEFTIQKSEISKINKSNTLATVGIVACFRFGFIYANIY
jgi:hypothetical protein